MLIEILILLTKSTNFAIKLLISLDLLLQLFLKISDSTIEFECDFADFLLDLGLEQIFEILFLIFKISFLRSL